MKKFNVKKLCVCAAFIAAAFVVNNFLFKFKMPYGGSATLFSMLLIFLPAYFYGTRIGLLCALCYGLLDLLVNPFIVHPIQLLLDYPLAFGAIGLGGIFNKRKYGFYSGYFMGISLRFVCSSISGALFLASYAPVGMDPLLYSLLYNGAYIYAEGAVTLIVTLVPSVKKAIERIKTSAIAG